MRFDAIKTLTGLVGLVLAGILMIYANTIPSDQMITAGCFAIWFIAWAFGPIELEIGGNE